MKQVKKNKDLAINGNTPAFASPIHVGRPNIGEREVFLKYVEQILDSQWLTNNGPLLQKFEQQVADHHGVKHCIAMSNGTVALEIAIRALGLEGEVIIPSYTFVATAHALHWQAITPVFADINPDTHTLDPDAVRRMITPRTTGIIGVHLWGRPAEVDKLQDVADEHNLKLMFDAAHAFGCSHQGQMIGKFGACEILSFHATKFINTFEGGAVLTNDDLLAKKMQLMRNFGFSGMDNVIHPGTNGKMTEIAAAMGLANLESIESVLSINRSNYSCYLEALSGLSGISLLLYDHTERNNFQYVIMEVGDECPVRRDEIIKALHAENILARRYFWPGCHNMKPYCDLFPHAGLMLPNTMHVAEKVVVLPSGRAMNEGSVKTVSNIIKLLIADDL